jgi:peptide deformylase
VRTSELTSNRGQGAKAPRGERVSRASRLDRVAEEHGQVVEEELDPESEARRRLALAQIRQYPDPVLRMKAREVEQFDDDLRRLVARMTALMVDARGVGLAATQVGVLRRVAIVQFGEDPPVALVNPRLVEQSDEVETDDEGCLSLQGVLVPVERPLRVVVEAKDADGDDLRLELEEHGARVAQHELDHLDGVLMLERTTPEARREALGTLRPQPVLGG